MQPAVTSVVWGGLRSEARLGRAALRLLSALPGQARWSRPCCVQVVWRPRLAQPRRVWGLPQHERQELECLLPKQNAIGLAGW